MAQTLADRVRIAREARGISARELGRRAGLSKSLVSAIERGESTDPVLSTVTKIARVLGLSLDELVTGRRKVA